MLVDFDGDGVVAEWEAAEYARWREDESMSRLLAAAMAQSPVSSDGVVDVSAYLAAAVLPDVPPEESGEAPGVEELAPEAAARVDAIGEDAAVSGAAAAAPALPAALPSVPTWKCMFKRGDLDRDGDCDYADYTALSSYLYYGTVTPVNLDAADIDDDGSVSSGDQYNLYWWLYYHQYPPQSPFSYWGLDPTYDLLELPCQDAAGFEHARNPIEEGEIAVPPQEGPPVEGGMLPSGPLDSVDGTGGFGAIAPALDTFGGPAGLRWGLVPSYVTRQPLRTNHTTAVDFQSELGYGWFAGIPHIVDLGSAMQPRYWVRWSASCVRAYTLASGSLYGGRFSNLTNLDAAGAARTLYGPGDSHTDYMLLYDFAGRVYVFYGWQAQSKAVKGRLRKIVAPGPNEIVLNWNLASGKLLTVEVKHQGAACQTWNYTYGTAAANKYRLTEVSMQRFVDEPPSDAKTYRVKLRYFGEQYANEVGGTTGDLMQLDVTESLTPFPFPGGMDDPKNKLTRSYYYRYFTGPYTGSGNGAGAAHQVREVYGPDACRNFDLVTYPATSLTAYAERIYEYCKDRRVRTLQARAASCCSGGNGGLYTYEWYLGVDQGSPDPQADDPAVEHMLVTVDQPHGAEADGLRRLVTYNTYGQITVDGVEATQPGNPQLLYFLRVAAYDDTPGDTKWFPAHTWWPAAVNWETGISFDETNPAEQTCEGTAARTFDPARNRATVLILPQTGKHRALEYSWNGSSLTVQERYGEGELGTTVPTSFRTYDLYDELPEDVQRRRYLLGRNASYYWNALYASEVYTYGFHTGAGNLLAVNEITAVRDPILTDQNGSGQAVTTKRWFSFSGNLMWERDGRVVENCGYVNFYRYDPVTFQTDTEVIDIDTSAPPITLQGLTIPYPSRSGTHANALTLHSYDGLGRTMTSEVEAGLSDDGSTNQRRVARYVYTKITGDSAKLSPDLPVTLAYPYASDAGVKLGEVSISVSTPGGKGYMSASGYPGGGTTPFYDAEWDPAATTLGAAYEATLISRSESEYDPGTGKLTESRIWLEPNLDGGWSADYSTYHYYDTCGRLEKTEGPDIDSGAGTFRQVDKTVFDAIGRACERWTGSGETDMLLVSKTFYDGAVDGTLKVGNGNVTMSRSYADAVNFRETVTECDGQDRHTKTLTPFDAASQIVHQTIYVSTVLPRVLTTKTLKREGVAETVLAHTNYLNDILGNSYGADTYGVEGGQLLEPDRSRTWRDEAGNVIKTKNPNGTFSKAQFDGAGREVRSFLCFDVDEADADYAAAGTVDGDTVITQSESIHDRAGNAVIGVSFERKADAENQGVLTSATALASVTETYLDALGRVETTVARGNIATPAPRAYPKPTATSADALVTRYAYGAALVTVRGLACRWSQVQNVDGTVSGTETDALGRTVRQWQKSRDSEQCKVVEFAHDALGHQVLTYAYKEYLTAAIQFGTALPDWDQAVKDAAIPCRNLYVWGVKKEKVIQGEGDLALSTVSSTGLLYAVYRPGAGQEDTISQHWHRQYAYNAHGQVIGEREFRSGGGNGVIIGRAMAYDMQGRKHRDAVAEGGQFLPGEARALQWDYDESGRLVSATTRSQSNAILDETLTHYDGYGQATEVWESHVGPVDPDTSFKVETSYDPPEVQGARYVGRRLTGRVVNANESDLDKKLYLDFTYEPNSISDFLCRPDTHSWKQFYWTGEVYLHLQYRTEEKFAGVGRWDSTDYWRDYLGSDPLSRLSLQESATYDKFLRPATFVADQYYHPDRPLVEFGGLWLSRLYSYESATSRLFSIQDAYLDDSFSPWPVYDPEYSQRVSQFDGFGETAHFNSMVNGNWLTDQSWTCDAAGNWTYFSGDFNPLPWPAPTTSRCYNRRGEILRIGADPDCGDGPNGSITYDEASRVTMMPVDQDAKFLFYDAWGRLVGFGPDDPENLEVAYRYDAVGRLIRREASCREYHYGPGNALACAFYDTEGPPQFYVRSSGSGRLHAVQDSSAADCFWCIMDARGENYGLCDFEEQTNPRERYRYLASGGVDSTEHEAWPYSTFQTQISGGMVAGGGAHMLPSSTEALTEEEPAITVVVGRGPFAFAEKIGAGLFAFSHVLGLPVDEPPMSTPSRSPRSRFDSYFSQGGSAVVFSQFQTMMNSVKGSVESTFGAKADDIRGGLSADYDVYAYYGHLGVDGYVEPTMPRLDAPEGRVAWAIEAQRVLRERQKREEDRYNPMKPTTMGLNGSDGRAVPGSEIERIAKTKALGVLCTCSGWNLARLQYKSPKVVCGPSAQHKSQASGERNAQWESPGTSFEPGMYPEDLEFYLGWVNEGCKGFFSSLSAGRTLEQSEAAGNSAIHSSVEAMKNYGFLAGLAAQWMGVYPKPTINYGFKCTYRDPKLRSKTLKELVGDSP